MRLVADSAAGSGVRALLALISRGSLLALAARRNLGIDLAGTGSCGTAGDLSAAMSEAQLLVSAAAASSSRWRGV